MANFVLLASFSIPIELKKFDYPETYGKPSHNIYGPPNGEKGLSIALYFRQHQLPDHEIWFLTLFEAKMTRPKTIFLMIYQQFWYILSGFYHFFKILKQNTYFHSSFFSL